MRWLLPSVLLAGCATGPGISAPVVAGSDAEAYVFAAAIAECVRAAVPETIVVTLTAPSDEYALAAVLVEFNRHWLLKGPDGWPVSYRITPVDDGAIIVVEAPPQRRCAQYFSRATGVLTPAGALTVTK